MKVFYKVCLRLALVLIVIGGALSIAGVACGASLNTMDNLPPWINLGFIERSRENRATTSDVAYEAISEETTVIEDDSSEYNNEIYNNEKIRAIQLDIDYGTVTIKQGEEFRVEYSALDDSFQSYADGDTLIVERSGGSGFNFFGLNKTKELGYDPLETIIYIPKDFHAEEVNITLGAGTVEIDRISADEISIDAGAGVINAQTLIVSEEGNFNVGAGEIRVKNIKANNVGIECGMGNVVMEGTMIGDNYVDCGVGKVELLINGNENDYNYNVNCGMGIIKINDRKYKASESATIENNSAKNEFDVNCDVGSVIIKIK